MSGYQYTYPDDLSYLNVLRPELREHAVRLLNRAKEDGTDLADLVADDPILSATDKADLVAVWS